MNKLLFGFLAVSLVGSSVAFSQRQNIEDTIEQRTRSLHDLVRYDRVHETLSTQEKDQLLNVLNESISILRGDRRPGRPGHGNGNRGGLDVAVIVESSLYNFEGDRSDIYGQCMNSVSNSNVDEITVVVHNSNVKRKTTSGWWSTKALVCNEILNMIDDGGDRYIRQISAYGSIENKAFNFKANTKAEALRQCVSAYRGLGNVDEFTLAVNSSPMRKKSTSGWWNNPSLFCYEFMKVIDEEVR